MKKILALVLAVAMMSTMAFAAPANLATVGTSAVNPGETLYILAANFVDGSNATLLSKFGNNADEAAGNFTQANFGVYKKSFSKGGNLVKSVTVNDNNGRLQIALNQDYSKTVPNSNNLIIDSIQIRALRNIDYNGDGTNDVTRSTIFKYDAAQTALKVGYNKDPMPLNAPSINYTLGNITDFNAAGGVAYATASATYADLYIEGRVYDGDEIYVDIDTDVGDDQKAALKAFPDADLRFVNLTVNNLPSNNTVNLLAGEDEFVYEISNGKVVKSSLKWSDDEYAWIGKARANKSYVISDIELNVGAASTDSAETTNPETGANDVVGVAAALAIISLVAAGAVSLKK